MTVGCFTHFSKKGPTSPQRSLSWLPARGEGPLSHFLFPPQASSFQHFLPESNNKSVALPLSNGTKGWCPSYLSSWPHCLSMVGLTPRKLPRNMFFVLFFKKGPVGWMRICDTWACWLWHPFLSNKDPEPRKVRPFIEQTCLSPEPALLGPTAELPAKPRSRLSAKSPLRVSPSLEPSTWIPANTFQGED